LIDAKGMNGVAVVTGRTWLPRSGLFMKNGFEKVDSIPPDLELLAKRFSDNASPPRFNVISKEELEDCGTGITVFKSDQCPYWDSAVKKLEEVAKQLDVPIRIKEIENCKQAQHNAHPYGTSCVLLDGNVVTYRPIGAKGLLNYLSRKES
jgi:hypothetical protein